MDIEQAALANAILNQRALLTAALTGSLTVMSILTASIGIMYGVYSKFCVPSLPDNLELSEAERPLSQTMEEFLNRPTLPICEFLVRGSRYAAGALGVSAVTAFFAALSLLGCQWSIQIGRAHV